MTKNMPLIWRKATRSGANDNCVEVAVLPDGYRAIRDSKNPGGALMRSSGDAWEHFIGSLKANGFR
ncbi:hypothetical protein Ssi03_40370 [Sphaerisporangium siamense]|uniref:DUF397 domain-containing protein n=1 Tax=Sphaerisporangium siamense TaxID=795645 RepID=A0A7W7G8Z5_9ACTN|nr:hypothetical protein [Sphaerisporangium siamense]GII86047.1 hypothetical protein Ssi03_40370 [Sphaerisporangium siamense]